MKIYCAFIVLFFLTSGEILSQDIPPIIFHVDSLPAEGIQLDNDWKFHPGDDPQWANP